MQFRPHLHYSGSCAEAFQFYSGLIGGELWTLLTYGDSPLAAEAPEEWHDKILQATLVIDGEELTGGDLQPGDYQRPQGFFVTASVSGKDEARRIFDGLAQDGQIRVPFEPTFWSPGFGAVTDRFDIPWELNTIERGREAGPLVWTVRWVHPITIDAANGWGTALRHVSRARQRRSDDDTTT